jgi:Kef-type K+ transport system membrane component KefB
LFGIVLYQGDGPAYYSGLLPVVKVLIFFGVSYLVGKYFIINILANDKKLNLENSILSLSIAIILIFAWFAEMLGLEAILGALLSGFFIGQTKSRQFIDSGITQVGKSFFVDIFFVSIGLGINLRELSYHPIF